MVAVRENLTEVEGEIVAREPHPRLAGFDEVVVKVERAAPVEGKPDLVRPAPGQDLPVAVRRELIGDAAPGARVRLRAARTSSGEVMAEPHPEPEHFAVL
jgi:hypothetical protein